MSLRIRFLIWVNAALIAVLTAFLVMDYRFQRSTHLAEISIDTQREAELLAQAVIHIDKDDRAAVRSLLDRTTLILRTGDSDRRDFVAVKYRDEVLVPTDHLATEYRRIVHSVGEDQTTVKTTENWLVGKANASGFQVLVLRDPSEAGQISAEHARWRLIEVGLLGLVATLLINLLFIRLVSRPFTDLAETIRRIGQGEHGATTKSFRSREFRLLAVEINQMSRAIERSDQERAYHMAKAGRLQQRLQGSGVQVPGLKVVHWHQAADHVAGDYFDLLHSPDGSWLICIADVTGHGVAAAMGAAILKTLLWSAVESGADLSCILQSVNQRFSEVTLEEDFASLMLIRWSPDSGTLQYASAGHETAYLLSEGAPPTFMESTGTLIGLAHDHVWEIKELAVCPGSRLVLYTDGIIEAFSPAGRYFGRERLDHLIHAHAERPIQDAVDAVVEALKKHLDGGAADDDLTLVGLEFINPSGNQVPRGPQLPGTRNSHACREYSRSNQRIFLRPEPFP